MASLRQLFTLEGRVSRGAYLRVGLALMALKYALEALAMRLVLDARWTPLDYFWPSYSLKASKLQAAPDAFLLALGRGRCPSCGSGRP